MADERYTRAAMPEPDTDVDLEPPMWRMIGLRYSPHRIDQAASLDVQRTLYFPRYSDELPTARFTT